MLHLCALFTINTKPITISESWKPEVSSGMSSASKEITNSSQISIYSHGVKITNASGINSIFEEFKGKVFDDKVKLHKTKMPDAVDHPFNFDILLKLYKKFGVVTAIIDKYVDFIVGNGFTIKATEPNAQKLIDEFTKDIHFESLLRKWIKEALLTGNSFMELGGAGKDKAPAEMKVLCSRNMFVARDDKGKVKNYYQYNPTIFGEAPEKFETHQIAHLAINQIGDDAYGYGIIHPMMHVINDFIKARKDMHTILKRKANSPLHATLGDAEKGIVPLPEEVDAFGKTMEFMNEKQEWATDPYVKFEVIDFGNIGDKFESVLKGDMQMISLTSQVPEVMMGFGNIPEGLAEYQTEGFEKRAHAFQIDIEKIIEEDIFSRVLLSENVGSEIDFIWGKPSKREVHAEITKITEMLKIFTLSDDLRYKLEDKLYELMDLDEREESPEEEKKRKDAQTQPAVPGSQNPPGAKFPVKKDGAPPQQPPNKPKEIGIQMIEHCRCKNLSPDHIHEDFHTDYSIQEWVGFDYDEFKENIIKHIETDSFPFLAAADQLDEEIGKLTEQQISKMRGIFKEGFTRGESINEMAKRIKEEVKPKDLLATDKKGNIRHHEDGTPMIAASKEVRPYVIARTETVRAAAEGALNTYTDNQVEKVQWIAAVSDRTCPTCLGLSNKIMPIQEARNQLPAHVMCRCTWVPVVEL